MDHIKGNKIDNRWNKLKHVSKSFNQQNRKLNKNNKYGCHGVYFNNTRNKWFAEIKINNKKIHIGIYDKRKNAIKARLKFEIQSKDWNYTIRIKKVIKILKGFNNE